MRKTTPFLFVCVLLICVSCGTPETELSGDIFVVTEGADSKKLGLVPIALYPFEEFAQHIERNDADQVNAFAKYTLALSECEPPKPSDMYDVSVRYYLLSKEAYESCKGEAHNQLQTVNGVYVENLPLSFHTASSDADGKFSMRIKATGKHVLVAFSSRKITDAKTEAYYWFVPVVLDGKTKKVTLSNNNLADYSESPLSKIRTAN